jgi:hypothetical protein
VRVGSTFRIHNGQIVYTPPSQSRCLIVWLTPKGDATAPWIDSACTGKRIVTTKPGDSMMLHRATPRGRGSF